MKTVTSSTIIRVLEAIFGRLGLPHSIRSDNGPQFISDVFQKFLQDNGVEHRRTTPLAPWQNGECERQNRSLMKAIRIAHSEGKDWRRELTKFLTAHRSTPHTSTGATPFFLMYGREMRTKLPDLCREPTILDEESRDKDWENKLKGKAYTDSKRNAQECNIKVGDQVLVKVPKTNKLSSNFDPVPRTVVSKEGGEVTVERDGTTLRRHSNFFKPYRHSDNSGNTDESREVSPEEDGGSRNVETVQDDSDSLESNVLPTSVDCKSRPQRNVRPPVKLRDYVCA